MHVQTEHFRVCEVHRALMYFVSYALNYEPGRALSKESGIGAAETLMAGSCLCVCTGVPCLPCCGDFTSAVVKGVLVMLLEGWFVCLFLKKSKSEPDAFM